MANPTRDAVLQALTRVIDPELRRPITDLGMVDSIEISDDGVRGLFPVKKSFPKFPKIARARVL